MTKKSATDIEIVPLGTAVKTLKELGQERQFIASWLANSILVPTNKKSRSRFHDHQSGDKQFKVDQLLHSL